MSKMFALLCRPYTCNFYAFLAGSISRPNVLRLPTKYKLPLNKMWLWVTYWGK